MAIEQEQFGANAWLVDELRAQYLADPNSVSDAWRAFFQTDVLPVAPTAPAPFAASAPVPVAPPAAAPAAAAPVTAAPVAAAPAEGEPIRGAAAAIAANMTRSLEVPTATSFRNIPARLLEVNRQGINSYRSRVGLGKVSFTHVIASAIVRAIADAVPNMNNGFAEGA
ncbi:MAG: 2-oxo acid dehydrogenase subunit E2, partial [Actinomycetota bacterium]